MFDCEDCAKGMMVVLMVIFAISLSFGFGFQLGKISAAESIESTCADYGKVKIGGKFYECKLK